MSNKFYAVGEERAARVQQLFDRIARRYDLINDLQSFGLHRVWKRRLIQMARGRPSERALDICCGTGDIALALAGQELEVVGLDFSGPMLAVAQRRAATWNASSNAARPPKFIRGDALSLPFPDNSFDVVTIGYGLRNLADVDAGLREMKRVAAPGGRLLVLDFGKPDNALWRSVYFTYLQYCVPPLGRIFCGDAETHGYILESLRNYAGQKGVDAKLKDLELVSTRILNLMGGIMSINYAEKR